MAKELSLTSRYVRRNLRKLSESDRALFFDAFQVMLTNSTSEGQNAYGMNYRSIDYFTQVHLNTAAARRADHMHDGMGFLTQHVALTNMFELALQSVAPSLAVPFWDITEDAALVRSKGGQRMHRLATGDLTGDGRCDVVGTAQNSHYLVLWLCLSAEEGGLTRCADIGVGTGPLDVALADLDGDGTLDIASANGFSNDLSTVTR